MLATMAPQLSAGTAVRSACLLPRLLHPPSPLGLGGANSPPASVPVAYSPLPAPGTGHVPANRDAQCPLALPRMWPPRLGSQGLGTEQCQPLFPAGQPHPQRTTNALDEQVLLPGAPRHGLEFNLASPVPATCGRKSLFQIIAHNAGHEGCHPHWPRWGQRFWCGDRGSAHLTQGRTHSLSRMWVGRQCHSLSS